PSRWSTLAGAAPSRGATRSAKRRRPRASARAHPSLGALERELAAETRRLTLSVARPARASLALGHGRCREDPATNFGHAVLDSRPLGFASAASASHDRRGFARAGRHLSAARARTRPVRTREPPGLVLSRR